MCRVNFSTAWNFGKHSRKPFTKSFQVFGRWRGQNYRIFVKLPAQIKMRKSPVEKHTVVRIRGLVLMTCLFLVPSAQGFESRITIPVQPGDACPSNGFFRIAGDKTATQHRIYINTVSGRTLCHEGHLHPHVSFFPCTDSITARGPLIIRLDSIIDGRIKSTFSYCATALEGGENNQASSNSPLPGHGETGEATSTLPNPRIGGNEFFPIL